MDKRWTLAILFTAFVSWSALWGVMQLPVGGLSKVIFFVALFGATSCTLMPAVAYLNKRFASPPPTVYRFRVLRQSGQLGLMIVVLAWLQMLRVLDWTLTIIVIGIFALIETFLITRDPQPIERQDDRPR